MPSVRTRFAPSPTGEMHVGNLRTAIFNYLFACRHGGAFVLRVEDTDAARNVEGSLERLLGGLRWAGLEWDEGPDVGGPFGPYLQSRREGRHRERALELRARGLAYDCYCSESEVAAARTRERSRPGCPGGCRERGVGGGSGGAPPGSPRPSLRFAVPDDTIQVTDQIRGLITFYGRDIGDFIILREDGRPTYNFAVVADDADMEITHVIRGAGHLPNTPKQALLFDAMGAVRPVFAHLPTVLAPDGSKLSKRTGAPGVALLEADGYHPDGVLNYLSLLGWSPGDDREVMSPSEIAAALTLDRVGASNTVYDSGKLRWLSKEHIARMPLGALARAVAPYIDRARFPVDGLDLETVVDALRSRIHTFGEVNQALALLFPSGEAVRAAVAELASKPDENARLLGTVEQRLEALEAWTADGASRAVREAGRELGRGGRALFHPLRLALLGARQGPDLGKVIHALGRREVLARLGDVRERIAP